MRSKKAASSSRPSVPMLSGSKRKPARRVSRLSAWAPNAACRGCLLRAGQPLGCLSRTPHHREAPSAARATPEICRAAQIRAQQPCRVDAAACAPRRRPEAAAPLPAREAERHAPRCTSWSPCRGLRRVRSAQEFPSQGRPPGLVVPTAPDAASASTPAPLSSRHGRARVSAALRGAAVRCKRVHSSQRFATLAPAS